MSLDMRIEGGAKLKLAAAQIKAVGDKPLGRRMSAALRAATKPLEVAVRAEAARVMPHSGGYAATLTRSLRFRNDVRSGARTASVRFRTYADGKGERRDVNALDRGVLRHPVWGHRGRAWSATRITAGFYTRPTAKAADLAEAEMSKVLDEVLDQLKG